MLWGGVGSLQLECLPDSQVAPLIARPSGSLLEELAQADSGNEWSLKKTGLLLMLTGLTHVVSLCWLLLCCTLQSQRCGVAGGTQSQPLGRMEQCFNWVMVFKYQGADNVCVLMHHRACTKVRG